MVLLNITFIVLFNFNFGLVYEVTFSTTFVKFVRVLLQITITQSVPFVIWVRNIISNRFFPFYRKICEGGAFPSKNLYWRILYILSFVCPLICYFSDSIAQFYKCIKYIFYQEEGVSFDVTFVNKKATPDFLRSRFSS